MKEIIIDGVTYICTPKEEQAVKSVEHEFVDLGLPSGRLWATCNIGAEKPTDCGDYFACGAVEPYDLNNCNIDSYMFSDAAFLSEMYDAYDAAKVLWGDEWRMPTLTDFAELIDNCTYNSEFIDGIRYGVFTSKANKKKIVMPCAGDVNESALGSRGLKGSYWSRSFCSEAGAWMMYFGYSDRDVKSISRHFGFSVRPVRS